MTYLVNHSIINNMNINIYIGSITIIRIISIASITTIVIIIMLFTIVIIMIIIIIIIIISSSSSVDHAVGQELVEDVERAPLNFGGLTDF